VILPVLIIPQANFYRIIFVASARASHHAFGQAELTRKAYVFAIVATRRTRLEDVFWVILERISSILVG
jgi:hypothetical protein